MIQCIVPRPIAWVLSDNGDQSLNLAPFSYFSGVSSKPPIISLSVGKKRSGEKKDTWRNIEERNHFVVHIAHTEQAAQVSATAASLAFGESEITANQLATTAEPNWPLPRLQGPRIALLCERHQIVEVGETPQGLVLGQILQIYLADEILDASDGNSPKVNIERLNPLARLGGDDYSAIGKSFTVERPA